MRILFYDAKKYDVDSFDKELVKFRNIEVEYLESEIPEPSSTGGWSEEWYKGVTDINIQYGVSK